MATLAFTSTASVAISSSPSSSPIPAFYVPFEDPDWFSLPTSYGYLIISCISCATLIFFIHLVYQTDYKQHKSLRKCLTSFTLLLCLMFLSIILWSLAALVSNVLYFADSSSVYAYYFNMQLNAANLGDFGSFVFRTSYLIFIWLRTKSLLRMQSKYFKLIQLLMFGLVPLVLCSQLISDVYFTSYLYRIESDPTFNSYFASFNFDTGSYDASLASSFALELFPVLNSTNQAYDIISAVTISMIAAIDLCLIAVFALAAAQSTIILEERNFKLIQISRFGLASSLAMLVATILQCIRSFDNDAWNSGLAGVWLDVSIITVHYITAMMLLLMKIAIHWHEKMDAQTSTAKQNSSKRKPEKTTTIQ